MVDAVAVAVVVGGLVEVVVVNAGVVDVDGGTVEAATIVVLVESAAPGPHAATNTVATTTVGKHRTMTPTFNVHRR